METGGAYTIPRGHAWPESHLVEISLHGIAASGTSEEDAQRNWINAARRAIRDEVTA